MRIHVQSQHCHVQSQHCHLQSQHCHDPSLSNMAADELHVDSIVRKHHVYVPHFLAIYAISKLCCAFCQLQNCVPNFEIAYLLCNLEIE